MSEEHDIEIMYELNKRFEEGRCICCGNTVGVLPSSMSAEFKFEDGATRLTSLKVCDTCRERIYAGWSK